MIIREVKYGAFSWSIVSYQADISAQFPDYEATVRISPFLTPEWGTSTCTLYSVRLPSVVYLQACVFTLPSG